MALYKLYYLLTCLLTYRFNFRSAVLSEISFHKKQRYLQSPTRLAQIGTAEHRCAEELESLFYATKSVLFKVENSQKLGLSFSLEKSLTVNSSIRIANCMLKQGSFVTGVLSAASAA